ncbi:MAG: GNAT family N-acetyltransferase [Chloroflexota bacterium]
MQSGGVGIRIYTLAELYKLEPNWKRKSHLLRVAINRDVPGAGPKQDITLEQFQQMYLDDSELDPEAWWVAVDETLNKDSADGVGPFVGYSNLWISDETRKKLFTGLTGVIRSHRRRGIATLLKLKAVAYGQRHHSEQIVTMNEENNPMLALNLKLGFQEVEVWQRYEKIF